MLYSQAIFTNEGVIFVGERKEMTFDSKRRDQFGIMYYPLQAKNISNKESPVFMSGGLDLFDLLNLGLVGSKNLLVRQLKTQSQRLLWVGTPQTGFCYFKFESPTIIGNLKSNCRIRSREKRFSHRNYRSRRAHFFWKPQHYSWY